ncbi:MAG: HDOD domain-containing protein [Chloroflexi bacterium]|nr:HDOD domain-containing protein [Chloroflexota bacterium]
MDAPTRHAALDELIAEISGLRPLPAVAVRVTQLTESDRFSAHELASVISSDQALTASILRLSNSAYYGFPRRIATVRDAVVLLGFRAVRSASLASCVMSTLHGAHNLDDHAFWRFSVSVGLIAEMLARTEGLHQEQAFTAGILHNVGLLALDQHRPADIARAIQLSGSTSGTLREAERSIIGFTDAELGGALALNWGFPPELAAAVRDHALPLDTLPDPRSLTAFVLRGRIFARANGVPDGIERFAPSPLPEEWTVPPLSTALDRGGGVDGLLDRVEAFLDGALAS